VQCVELCYIIRVTNLEMSILTFGAHVDLDVLDDFDENQELVRTAPPRDPAKVAEFIRSLKVEDTTGQSSFASSRITSTLEMYRGVTWRIDPTTTTDFFDEAADGTTMYLAKPDRDGCPSFALKVMESSKTDGGSAALEGAIITKLAAREHAFEDSIPAALLFSGVAVGGGVKLWGVAMELADGSLGTFEVNPIAESHAVHLAYAVYQEIAHMWEVTGGLLHTDLKTQNFLYILGASNPDRFTVSMADYGSLAQEGSKLVVASYVSPAVIKSVRELTEVEATWAHVALGLGMLVTIFMGARLDKHFTNGSTNAIRACKAVKAWAARFPGAISTLVCTLLQYNEDEGRLLPTQQLDDQPPPVLTAHEAIKAAFDAYFAAADADDMRIEYPRA
jgi:hypothetical protein